MTLRKSLVLVSVLALAGCGPRELDMQKVKDLISNMIKTQVGANVKGVTCPDKRELKAGDSFECQAEIDQGKVPVTITQKDATGQISAELKSAILVATVMEKAIATNIKQTTGTDVTVDCGPRFRPSTPNDTFNCTAKAGAESETVKVTVKDDKGNVNFNFALPPAGAPSASEPAGHDAEDKE
jgi:hypothetical protein